MSQIKMNKLKMNNNQKNNISDINPVISNRRYCKLEQLMSIISFGLNKKKSFVSVLRLDGVIGKVGAMKSGLTLCALNDLIEKTFKNERLSAVCLVINSPGGSPVQSELIANRIINLAAEKNVPVYSFVEDVAASGGYWLACAGDKIYVSRSSIIGSIGVISSGFGFSELIKKIGVERRIYTQGMNKSVLDPFTPEKESDVDVIKKIQKDIHEHFIQFVKKRRQGSLTQTDEILFNGEFWCGQTAVDFGLVDGINDLYSFIKNKFGDDVKIEYIEPKQSWFKKKLGMSLSLKKITDHLAESLLNKAESKIKNDKFDFY